jgi:hypothetical protein
LRLGYFGSFWLLRVVVEIFDTARQPKNEREPAGATYHSRKTVQTSGASADFSAVPSYAANVIPLKGHIRPVYDDPRILLGDVRSNYCLIAREAKSRGGAPVLAGRNAPRGIRLVLNCAGPFSKTAGPLMRACMSAKADYMDITGEIDVLEGAHGFDADAKSAGVVLCPGAGFDVVPTDCTALMLKNALPEAKELALGFESSDRGMSAGTAKTLVEGLGKSGKIRRTSILGVA